MNYIPPKKQLSQLIYKKDWLAIIIVEGSQKNKIYAVCINYARAKRFVRECEKRKFGKARIIHIDELPETRIWAQNPHINKNKCKKPQKH